MANNEINVRHQLAYKTSAEWYNANPVLLNGELAYTSDQGNIFKIGNGTSTWRQLPYVNYREHSLIHKKYESTAYYANSAGSWEAASWYFMSVKPDSWYKPWRVKFKVHSYCPSHTNVDSYTWATYTGRADAIAYCNWNERYDGAHYYLPYYPLKKAGFDAGYGHAIGISILYSSSYTSSAYYRTFEIDYYECENCTVTILDTPVKWASWIGTGTTNYGSLGNPDAYTRGLRETGDDNTTTENRIGYFPGKTGAKGIWAASLFMEDANGTYQDICTASDGTVTSSNRTTDTTKIANTNGFKVGGTIWYANTTYAANTNISGYGVVYSSISIFDSRYAFNTTLTANSLTPYKEVYLVGTIHDDNLFYLDTVWWTQTPTDTSKIYILVGACFDSTTSNCRVTLYEQNIWYYYDGTMLREYVHKAKNADVATNAEKVNNLTVQTAVPQNAKFTDSAVTQTASTAKMYLVGNTGTPTITGGLNKTTSVYVEGSTVSGDWFTGSAASAVTADSAGLATEAVHANSADTAGTAALGMRRVFIQGTQTTATTTGKWTGDASPYFDSADDLVDGQEITYWVPLPTTGNVTLNLKFGNGTSSGEVNCYYGNTSRLTSHYGQGQAVHLTYRKNVKIPSTGTNTYTGWWADANYDSNSNTIDVLQGSGTIPVAGATAGLKQYSLFAEDANGKYSSFTTQNGTAVTKTINRTDYFDISKIYYCSTSGNFATNANIGSSVFRWASALVDLRYTLNINGNNGLTARKPLYLKFDAASSTIGTEGRPCYKLAGTAVNDWWTQTLPTSADDIIYVKVSEAVYDWYRADLDVQQRFFKYDKGYDALHSYKSSWADKATTAAEAEFAKYATNDANGKDIRTQYLTTAYSPTREEVLTPIGNACNYSGSYGIAIGQNSTASKSYSLAAGSHTITPRNNSAVFGIYNASTASSMTIFDIGIGESDSKRVSAFMVDMRGGSIVSDLIFASKVSGNKLGDNFCGIPGQPSIRHEYAVVNSWPAFLESDTSHMVTTSYDLVTTSMYALGVITPQRYSDAGSEVAPGNYMSRLRGIRDSFNTYSVPFTNTISGTGTVTGSVDITFPFTFYKQPIAIYISIGGSIQLTGESITDDFGGKSAAAIVDPQLHINGSYNVPATGATTASVAYRLRGFDSGTKTVKGNILILFD